MNGPRLPFPRTQQISAKDWMIWTADIMIHMADGFGLLDHAMQPLAFFRCRLQLSVHLVAPP